MRSKLENLPLYIGGFMGPFGTVVVVPMFPELREEFAASSSAVGLSFSLYLIPFAALLLVSGTLGERWGRRRTVRGTYLLYAVTSIACVLAPSLAWFIAARAAQGVANAFITPLLMAGLAERVPPARFGRAAGTYASFQALGSTLGPLIGGWAADTDWTRAFWFTAVVAATLALFPPPGEPRPSVEAPRFGPLLNRRLILLGLSFFFAAAGPVGIGVLLGVVARDELGLGGTSAGVILMLGSLSAFFVGPIWGRLLDRYGPRRAGVGAAIATTLAAAATALATDALVLGAIWIVGGALVAFVAVVYQGIGATVMPDNRGGALSFILSLRFAGHAVGPIVFIPLLAWSAPSTLLIAASLGVVTIWLTAIAAPDSTITDT